VTLALVLLSVAVALGAVAVARGQVRGGLEPATTSRAYRPLPEGAMTPEDVDAVRLTVALLGYRMDEVEAVLDRLRDELAARDERIAALERRAGGTPGSAPVAADPPAGGQEDEPARERVDGPSDGLSDGPAEDGGRRVDGPPAGRHRPPGPEGGGTRG
jgi:DivIVA domain-containing protein